MQKLFGFLLLATAFSCSNGQEITLTVNNPLDEKREQEIVELSLEALPSSLTKEQTSFILSDSEGRQIPYQITNDGKMIFPVTIEAQGKQQFKITQGTPDDVEIITCGALYTERLDDIAWENDCIAFRTYGPALQATGEKAFGYDIWTKSVTEPVVKSRYDKELKEGISYHVDHGNGLDFYSVGPTLGAGTTALMVNDSIVYPYCYRSYEILDNGPLRFTVRLTYNPLVIGNDTEVIEKRTITLDAGSHLNRTTIAYENLSQTTPMATGLVMHTSDDAYANDTEAGYIAYGDKTDETNGQIYVAAIIPQSEKLKETKVVRFSEEEQKSRRATGHLLAIADYQPGSSYTYYWGGGWSHYKFPRLEDWFDYVRSYTKRVNHPLTIQVD